MANTLSRKSEWQGLFTGWSYGDPSTHWNPHSTSECRQSRWHQNSHSSDKAAVCHQARHSVRLAREKYCPLICDYRKYCDEITEADGILLNCAVMLCALKQQWDFICPSWPWNLRGAHHTLNFRITKMSFLDKDPPPSLPFHYQLVTSKGKHSTTIQLQYFYFMKIYIFGT